MNPIMTLPATCELCQYVMPSHSSSCPRNGVHPSQWSLAIDEIIKYEEEKLLFGSDNDDACFKLDNDTIEKEETHIKKSAY